MAATNEPTVETAVVPVTALAFLRLRTSNPYLLTGEGPLLKVFDGEGRRLIHTERIFDSQTIHGIACKCLPHEAGTLLIWGGRSVCLIPIETDVDMNGQLLVVNTHPIMPEVLWDDWILDGCFLNARVIDRQFGRNIVEAFLVTAHNEIVGLKSNAEVAGNRGNPRLCRTASGPISILYSAHMLWVDAGRSLLIAAGTVFGEVLLWSLTFDHPESPVVCVHHRFTGHEGSVFGVRISDVVQTGAVRRILASCSDDRTIRIWSISDMSSGEKMKHIAGGDLISSENGLQDESSGAESTGWLAMIMGHASRIWGLYLLSQKAGCWDLISYGEDSTAQAWHVSSVLDRGQTVLTPRDHAYRLSHQDTYSHHSGKNLWAMAVFQEGDEDCIVATGGADGRITTYKPRLPGMPAQNHAWTNQYTMDEVSKSFQIIRSELSPRRASKARSSTANTFYSLKGCWKLVRNLNSFVSTYPSGTLKGTATFADRPPTDGDYEAEYLYCESGNFMTPQGLTMKATRQYVYRYSRSKDAISVWFVKPDDGSVVDYFFHQLDFRDTNLGIGPGPEVRTASGYHLCVEDNYNANYSFQLRGSKITQWCAKFDVDGPKKGYIAEATYTRDRAETVEFEEPDRILVSTSNRNAPFDNQRGPNASDTYKTYTWLSENEFLTTTEQGNLLVGTLISNTGTNSLHCSHKVVWEHVGYHTGLISACIPTSIPSLDVALLTGTDGTIFFYSHRTRKLDTIGKVPSKAGFLRAHVLSGPWNVWLGSSDQGEMVGLFATCLGSSQVTVFMFQATIHAAGQSTEEKAGSSAILEYSLTLPPKFIVTSSCFLNTEKWIVLGSRNGDVAIYDLANTTPSVAVNVKPEFFQHMHGEDAITVIQTVPRNGAERNGRTAFVTAGRDGKWAIHHVFHTFEKGRLAVTFQTIHVGVPPFGPNIEGAYIDSTSKDLLLWGFRSKHFVVWNESQKTEVMTVDCGGAHRNWAYTPNQDGSGGGKFVYTKASVCHFHSQRRASHQVIQHGGHGREIKAMAVSPAFKTDNDTELRFVATGAEDTAIRIFDLNANLKCLNVITKHTTGIQQLRWSSDGRLLVSAAGCEEFFVWRLRSAPLVTVGVVCEAQCPTVTEEADLRIMDFEIEEIHPDHNPDDVTNEPDYLLSIVYSDSSVRIFRYHTSTREKRFELLTKGSYTTCCLTQANQLHLGETLSVLCTASTDGHLAFWPLPNALSGQIDSLSTIPPLRCTTRTAIHQNSIKALDSIALSPSETLIATGGDDGAIALTRVRIPPSPSEADLEFDITTTTGTLLLPSAHASAVTGVVFITNSNTNSNNNKTKSTSHTPHSKQNNDDDQDQDRGRKLSHTLVSVGNDQRLRIWNVSIDLNLDAEEKEKNGGGVEGIMDVKKVASVYTGIADAGCLGTYRDEDMQGRGWGWWVLVAGIGVERWRVDGARE